MKILNIIRTYSSLYIFKYLNAFQIEKLSYFLKFSLLKMLFSLTKNVNFLYINYFKKILFFEN